MKKTLILLLSLFLSILSANSLLAEDNEQNQTIELIAQKSSTYRIRLPRQVDISENTSTFDIEVCGEISTDKKIVITYDDTDLKLVDQSENDKKDDIILTVSLNNNEFIYSDLTDDFDNATKKATFTITHTEIGAGTYKGSLPVTIKMVNR